MAKINLEEQFRLSDTIPVKKYDKGGAIKKAVKKASEALGEHEGKYLNITQSDRMRVGGKDLGGPGFPTLSLERPEYEGAVWGVGNPSVASTIIGANKRYPEGQALWTTMIGSPEQHRSNQHVFDELHKQFKKSAKAGNLDPVLHSAINDRLRMAVDADGLPMFPEDIDILSKDFKKFADRFDKRAVAADVMAGVGIGGKKAQIFDYGKVMSDLTDPMVKDVPAGSLGYRLFTLSGEKSERPDLHSAFPHILHGEDLGVSYTPAPREIIMQKWIDDFMQKTGRKPGFLDWTRGYAPSTQITEEMLTNLQREGFAEGGEVKGYAGAGLVKKAAKNLSKFMKDSKAVDEAGNPKVFYHGTTAKEDFSEFNPASFFTDSPKEASAYTMYKDLMRKENALKKYSLSNDTSHAGKYVPYTGTLSDVVNPEVGSLYATDNGVFQYVGDGRWQGMSKLDVDYNKYDPKTDSMMLKKSKKGAAVDTVREHRDWTNQTFTEGEGGRVYPVYLDVKNPVELSAMEANLLGKRLGAEDSLIKELIEKYSSQGYDSIKTMSDEASFFPEVKESLGGIPTQYIPFRPEQIKSAVGNVGAYDPNAKDILKAQGGSVKGYKAGGDLEEEFRKADMIDMTGFRQDPMQSAMQRAVNQPKKENPYLTAGRMLKRAVSAPIRVGQALGSAAGEQVAEEARYAKDVGAKKYLKDVGTNIAADIAGQLEESQPVYSIYRALKGEKPIREKVMGDTRELPATTIASEILSPAAASKAGKLVKALEGLPVGMSIEDVTPKTVNFVSSVEKAIKGHKMESMNGEQWANWMRANASKSAKKEAEATGLYDWLKSQGKVSKADIEAYVEGNLPQIEPVVRTGPKATYATYTEPGGRNYREIVYALKKKPSEVPMPEGFKITEFTNPETGNTGYYAETPSTISALFRNREDAERQLQRYAENIAKSEDTSKTYTSGHYRDIDNPLVHMRVKDRETPEGRRVHFLEELQSDWAQKARKKGIKQDVTDDVVREYYETHGKRGDNSLPWEELPSKDKAFLRHIIENRQVDAVPPAPYITDTADWTKLGLKRALKDAIESGQDYLAWTTGQQQADRYSLSKYLENVRAHKNPEGTYSFYAYEKGANRNNLPTIGQSNLTENELADHLGKEMAQKIVNDLAEAKPTQIVNYDNIDLQLGGEGMKGYYDKIVPQAMNDILKQYGITDGVKPVNVQYANKIYYDDRVEDLDDLLERGQLTPHQRQILEVFRDDIDSAKARGEDPWRLESNVAKWIAEQNRAPDTITEHMGIEITPELREKILNEGLPHFKAGGSVDVVPFPRDN